MMPKNEKADDGEAYRKLKDAARERGLRVRRLVYYVVEDRISGNELICSPLMEVVQNWTEQRAKEFAVTDATTGKTRKAKSSGAQEKKVKYQMRWEADSYVNSLPPEERWAFEKTHVPIMNPDGQGWHWEDRGDVQIGPRSRKKVNDRKRKKSKQSG
jgi:hypothetical protein